MANLFCNSNVHVGTVVIAMRNHYFCDNTMHRKDEEIFVSEGTLAYYRMFTDNFNYSIKPATPGKCERNVTMAVKETTETVKKNWVIRKSRINPEELFWIVYDTNGVGVGSGYCNTYDCAFRAIRNFIRHNQNLVYKD